MLCMLTEDESSDISCPECAAVWTGQEKYVFSKQCSVCESVLKCPVLCPPVSMCGYRMCICCKLYECVCVRAHVCVCVAMCSAREVALF